MFCCIVLVHFFKIPKRSKLLLPFFQLQIKWCPFTKLSQCSSNDRIWKKINHAEVVPFFRGRHGEEPPPVRPSYTVFWHPCSFFTRILFPLLNVGRIYLGTFLWPFALVFTFSDEARDAAPKGTGIVMDDGVGEGRTLHTPRFVTFDKVDASVTRRDGMGSDLSFTSFFTFLSLLNVDRRFDGSEDMANAFLLRMQSVCCVFDKTIRFTLTVSSSLQWVCFRRQDMDWSSRTQIAISGCSRNPWDTCASLECFFSSPWWVDTIFCISLSWASKDATIASCRDTSATRSCSYISRSRLAFFSFISRRQTFSSNVFNWATASA